MATSQVIKRRSSFKDITGKRFARLIALRTVSRDAHGDTIWEFGCDCGGIIHRKAGSITCGHTRSCGCLQRECAAEQSRRMTIHGESRSKEYLAWHAMLKRCYDPKNRRASTYRNRGITVCDRWRESFDNFLADMGRATTLDHSIDRIDNDGNYCPENCRWATFAQQAVNRTTNRYMTYGGKTQTVSQWSRETGIGSATLIARLIYGWSDERAITTPLRKDRRRKH